MIINFAPTIKQHICYQHLQDKTISHILYGGSIGGGKSYLGSYWIFLQCLMYPGSRHLIGRSRLNVLKRTTLKTLLDIIKTNKFQEKVNFNSQTNTLTFDNGSEILLLDLFPYPADPDYDRLGSLEITSAFIDELSEIPYKAFEILFTRIRYKLTEFKLVPKMLCCSNPTAGWAYNYFYKPFVDKAERNGFKFVQALPTDNPHLPATYLQGLDKNLSTGFKRRLLYGDWDFSGDDDALFVFEKLQESFYNDYFENVDDKSYITCDIADLGNDSTVLAIWKGWSLIRLVTLKKKETTEVVAEIKRLMLEYRTPISNIIIDSVGVGAGVASLLKGCVRYSGGERALNNEKFRNIKTQLMYKFADKINLGQVNFAMEYNDNLVQECLLYKKEFHNEVACITSKEEVKQRLGKSPDIIDALYLRAYFEINKKTPMRFALIN